MAEANEPTPEERRALFRVVRGQPSDAELAALTVVLVAAATVVGDDEPQRDRPAWGDPAVNHRHELSHGPGAWRRTYHPR